MTCAVHMAYCCLFLTALMVSGALIPERNGLSQFNEDADPLPVREFNLIACLLA